VNLVTDISNSDNQQLTGDNLSLNGDVLAGGDKKPSSGLPVNHTFSANHTSPGEALIVHAGAVVSMLHILPSIACRQQPQVSNRHLIC